MHKSTGLVQVQVKTVWSVVQVTSTINFSTGTCLQVILRADAHSSFGQNNRWGFFKGLSFGWRFSDEPFLSSLDFLGESMLRVSWGVAGRQPGDPYARFATYESTSSGSYIVNPAIAPIKYPVK